MKKATEVSMPAAELVQKICERVYTPAVYDHLESLRRSYEAQRDIARNRLEECNADGDSDGVKIAQIDMNLALRSLLVVNNQLFMAQQETVNGGAKGNAERTVGK